QSLLAAVSTEADQVGHLLVGTVDRVEEVPGDGRIGQGRRAEVGDHQNGQTGEYEARETLDPRPLSGADGAHGRHPAAGRGDGLGEILAVALEAVYRVAHKECSIQSNTGSGWSLPRLGSLVDGGDVTSA